MPMCARFTPAGRADSYAPATIRYIAPRQLPEPDEIALAVGQVAIQAAWLEYFTSLLAAVMIGTPRADAFVFGQGWSAVSAGLRALLMEQIEKATDGSEEPNTDTAFYSETLRHLGEADKLMVERGNVVHALWSLPNDAGERDAITHKRWKPVRIRTWTLAELRDLRTRLNFRMAVMSDAVDRITRSGDDGDVPA